MRRSGAGGFLGINLARGLLAAGAIVTGFGRRPHDPGDLPAALPWIDADFMDADRLADAIAGQDFVYHLLGGSVPAGSNDRPSGDVIGSLLPSLRLIEACRTGAVGRLIFASSGGTVYGPTARQPTPETAATNPITAYGINKLGVEKYLSLFRHLHGFDPIALRIANPYGPYQYGRRPQGLVGTAIAHALAGDAIRIWGDGSVVREYLHVDDVTSAMIGAASYRGPHQLFNVGLGEGRSVTQVVDSVQRLTAVPADRVRREPGRPVDIPYNVLDIGLIGQEMSWRPIVGWDDGLARTIAWHRDRMTD